MGKITVETCGIEGLKIISPAVFGDARGYFMETYNYNDFKEAGIPEVFVQDNQSASKRGVLRGLHFQIQHPQAKLVRVIRGEVFDVAVDLRKDSPTYGQWHGEILSEENKKQFFVPKNFAHGFLVLSEYAVPSVSLFCSLVSSEELSSEVVSCDILSCSVVSTVVLCSVMTFTSELSVVLPVDSSESFLEVQSHMNITVKITTITGMSCFNSNFFDFI